MGIEIDAARIEEAGLNALQTQWQLFFDGWLLRLSPGSAKRARSVNPHFASSLPVEAKIDRCETIYAAAGLPALFRITPFRQPPELDDALDRRGYVAFDRTLVQVVRIAASEHTHVDGARIEAVRAAEFVEAAGTLRASHPSSVPRISNGCRTHRLRHMPSSRASTAASSHAVRSRSMADSPGSTTW